MTARVPSIRARRRMVDVGKRREEKADPALDFEGFAYTASPLGGSALVIAPDPSEPWLGLLQLRWAAEELEDFVTVYVSLARRSKLDWETIGSALGVTRQTAAQRWGFVDDDDELAARAEAVTFDAPPVQRRPLP